MVRATMRRTACDRLLTQCRAWGALSVSSTTATRTPKEISPLSRAAVLAGATLDGGHSRPSSSSIISSTSMAAAWTRHPSGGSVWRSSHWWCRVSGATYLCAPAIGAESTAAAAGSLTKQRESEKENAQTPPPRLLLLQL